GPGAAFPPRPPVAPTPTRNVFPPTTWMSACSTRTAVFDTRSWTRTHLPTLHGHGPGLGPSARAQTAYRPFPASPTTTASMRTDERFIRETPKASRWMGRTEDPARAPGGL